MRSNRHVRFDNAGWVVTGAASGFGREFVRQLSASGARVSAWDRDAAGLQTLSAEHGAAHTAVVDVTNRDAVRTAFADAVAAVGPLAGVVNSAGVLVTGPAEETGASEFARMFSVNTQGSIHVALEALPALREGASPGQAPGHVLLIASVAGLRGYPGLAAYSASKCAVVGFAQALRAEVLASGVSVSALCPPQAKTPMVDNLSQLPEIYKVSGYVTAETVAAQALRALHRGQAGVLVTDAKSRWLRRVDRLAPGLVDRLVRRLSGNG